MKAIIIAAMIFLAMGCARDVYPPLCKHNALLAAAVISGLYTDEDDRIDFGQRRDEYCLWHYSRPQQQQYERSPIRRFWM